MCPHQVHSVAIMRIEVFQELKMIYVIALSFHRPKFCANATWNPNGITFANASTRPFGIFIDLNDVVYATEQITNRVDIWSENGTTPIRVLSGQINNPGAIFVSDQGDIYVDGGSTKQIVKWTPNNDTGIVVINTTTQCLGLFIDVNNSLYCSGNNQPNVTKVSLNSSSYSWILVAGKNIAGPASDELNHPNGIFVTDDFDLYVADYTNNRIQRFRLGQSNATTVAGGTSGTISLNGPVGVTLDVDGYLFIVDAYNHRVVAQGPSGFRCIAACSGSSGSTPTTLSEPRTLAFDSHGNLYVADMSNNRIQKFILMANSCSKS